MATPVVAPDLALGWRRPQGQSGLRARRPERLRRRAGGARRRSRGGSAAGRQREASRARAPRPGRARHRAQRPVREAAGAVTDPGDRERGRDVLQPGPVRGRGGGLRRGTGPPRRGGDRGRPRIHGPVVARGRPGCRGQPTVCASSSWSPSPRRAGSEPGDRAEHGRLRAAARRGQRTPAARGVRDGRSAAGGPTRRGLRLPAAGVLRSRATSGRRRCPTGTSTRSCSANFCDTAGLWKRRCFDPGPASRRCRATRTGRWRWRWRSEGLRGERALRRSVRLQAPRLHPVDGRPRRRSPGSRLEPIVASAPSLYERGALR